MDPTGAPITPQGTVRTVNGVPVLFDAPRAGEAPRRRQGKSRERHGERDSKSPPKDVVELAGGESRRDRGRDAKATAPADSKKRRPDAGYGPIDLRA